VSVGEYRKAREIITRLMEQSPDNATLPNDLAWYDAQITKLENAEVPEIDAVQGEPAP
jgi:hypothetical protein